jgi:Synaptobrevin
MQYCVDHPEEISKLAKVKAQVSEVKGVMMENIEKVIKWISLCGALVCQ